MGNYYIIKRVNRKSGDFKYYLAGHSELSTNSKPESVSKYYLWNSIRAAKSAMTRLMKNFQDVYDWEVCKTSEEGIEVK